MTEAHVEGSDELMSCLQAHDLPADAVVLDASAPVPDWDGARAVLMHAFEMSQGAALVEAPIVYVVHGDDLLGKRGAPAAMVATGLLSAARTAAIELSRKKTPVNVVAVGDNTDPELTARWVSRMMEPGGPTGELIRLDPSHLGKTLP